MIDQFKKIDVNGENEDPLYTYLKEQQGFKGFSGMKAKLLIPVVKSQDKDWKTSSNIKWNFTKFLVNRRGDVIKRYPPTTKPEDIEKDIIKLLKDE